MAVNVSMPREHRNHPTGSRYSWRSAIQLGIQLPRELFLSESLIPLSSLPGRRGSFRKERPLISRVASSTNSSRESPMRHHAPLIERELGAPVFCFC
jgi:hypothetical protein